MIVPQNFIENNLKLFIRFCKENDLYGALKKSISTTYINYEITPVTVYDSLQDLIQKEKNFFASCEGQYKVGYKYDITLTVNTFEENVDGWIYFSLVRLLNQTITGFPSFNHSKFIYYHKQLVEYMIHLNPNFSRYII